MDLPSDVVTFVFSDIEGSTRLWEERREAMRIALECHDAVLNKVIEEHDGHVFYTGGDSFGAAFASPLSALATTIEIQRSLAAEDWPEETGQLRVRMALHTGTPEMRDGDYFGPPVNRTARLMSAAHGGQILLSTATQQLVRDGLSEGVSLVDLGQHQLKDLLSPETVFQLTAPGLEAEFPALGTLNARPTNLPTQMTPFVGRERELAAVIELILREDIRLVTLTGPGGVGKTRLSLQAAADLVDEFAHGVFFVELAPIGTADQVLSAIGSVFGVSDPGDGSMVEVLKQVLRRKRILLVVDNFEHVVDAAPLIGELISGLPDLKVVSSSREPLRIYGEQEYSVPPLDLPDDSQELTLEIVSQNEAVSFFLQRARAAHTGFEIDERNARSIAEICTRLDGLPLAIELAAARVRLFEPHALLARLSDSLGTLTGGARDVPQRQQTIRGAIEWSHDLLDTNEQVLFARLSVFQGGRTFEAIEEVCGPDLGMDILEGVDSLLAKNLLRREQQPGGDSRYVMLETIHAFAAEQLQAGPEGEPLRARHAEYFASMAEEAHPQLTGHDQGIWLHRLTVEYENIRKAMEWSLGGGDVGTGVRLVAGMGMYWRSKSYMQEGQRWVRRAMELADDSPDYVQGRLYRAGGFISWVLGDGAECRRRYRKALEIERRLKNLPAVANLLISLGWIPTDEIGVDITKTAEGLALAREIGDEPETAHGLNVMGEIHRWQGNYPAAKQVYEEGLSITRKIGHRLRETMILANLGLVAFNLDDLALARARFAESYRLAVESDDDYIIADGLSFAGGVVGNMGEFERGIRLIGAGERQMEAIGSRRQFGDQFELDKMIARIREQVDDETYERLLVEGEALTRQEAIELALQEQAPDDD